MRLTFGEEIEIEAIKGEIVDTVNQGGNFFDKIVSLKLKRIAKISCEEADKAIKDCGLDELGWKPTGKKGRLHDS